MNSLRYPRLSERFEVKVMPEPTSGCLLWIGRSNRYGYIRGDRQPGQKRGEALLAHRVAWELANGPIPNGMCVCHRCDTPLCVNHEHLFLGTNADNSADMVAKSRQAMGEQNGYSKLTRDDVEMIRRGCAAGETQQALADAFGIHQAHVSRIVLGKLWRNATAA